MRFWDARPQKGRPKKCKMLFLDAELNVGYDFAINIFSLMAPPSCGHLKLRDQNGQKGRIIPCLILKIDENARKA